MIPAAPAALPAIRITDVSKAFAGRDAVHALSLSVSAGERYALLGANGAGKTTTLRMIAGLLAPDAGTIEILGRDLGSDPSAAKQELAFLPDEPMLYGKLRSEEYLEFVAGLWRMDPRVAGARSRELLEWLGLWDARAQYVETFSRGMQQKLALAGALIHAPRVLVLDEPLTGLDVASARRIREHLASLAAGGTALLFTTHIVDVAERLASRIGLLRQGRLVAEGSLEDLRGRMAAAGASLEDIVLEFTGDRGETG